MAKTELLVVCFSNKCALRAKEQAGSPYEIHSRVTANAAWTQS